MRVAFIGTRGVPASYSGFETFVEQLGSRLAERGHEVTVYCRRHHCSGRAAEFKGMRLIHVPGLATKHLDTISHTFVSCLHALTQPYDVAVMCISGNSPLTVLLRLAGTRVVLNVDGSDWRRKKWGAFARAYIRVSEWLATRLPDAAVTDSAVMQRYYRDRFGAETECIVYGADVPPPSSDGTLQRLGLRPREYLLFVGRLVPENCAHHLVEAYRSLNTDKRCVVVGDAPYVRTYVEELKRNGPDVIFPGYVFGEGYRELMHNAYAFVLCSEVGGTHPVLVEAMASGNCVVVNNTPANLEVIGDAGVAYEGHREAQGLAEVLERVLHDEEHVAQLRERARARAEAHYSWEAVTDSYERLLLAVKGRSAGTEPGQVLVASERADS